MRVYFVLVLIFIIVPLSTSQKCNSKADCKSKYAPHCSKWGWCQWTKNYGTAGKAQGAGLQAGECRSHLDCTNRAPVCSPEGFCTDNGRGLKINRKPKYPVFEAWTPEDNKIETEEAIDPHQHPGQHHPVPTTTFRTTSTTTTTSSESDLSSICSSPNGLFPHPTDCQVYYQCHGGTPVLGTCQAGFRWSVQKNYCDWSKNVVCEKTKASTTTAATPTTTTTAPELFEDIFENDAISINQLNFEQENVIRNQRLTVENPKEGPTNKKSAGPVTFQLPQSIPSQASTSSQAVPQEPLRSITSRVISSNPLSSFTRNKASPSSQRFISQAVPSDPLPPTTRNQAAPRKPLPSITSNVVSSDPLPRNQPVAPESRPSSTRSWAPRQSGFRALPAVPGRPPPYKRPIFSLYDAVPKT